MTRALSALKTKDLKRLAFLTGCPLATTKVALQKSLVERLGTSTIDDVAPRVLSVDMGIRNLAYCVVDVTKPATGYRGPGSTSGLEGRSIGELDITHWQKLDLLSQMKQIPRSRLHSSISPALAGDLADQNETLMQTPPSGLFTPPVISEIAFSFTQVILSHQPSVILIERQRFRSGGGSAIQEWTIRVNMLESMLWACLATVGRMSSTKATTFPAVYSVEPARVAKFWLQMQTLPHDIQLESTRDEASQEVEADSSKRIKVTKAQRMAILRKWMQDGNDGILPLKFSGQAEKTAQAFIDGRSKSTMHEAYSKLDDLTDCLLQAAAWIRWESNRRSIQSLLLSSDVVP